MEPTLRHSAYATRALLSAGELKPTQFRAALEMVPAPDRDAWFDLIVGIDHVAADGPYLPRSCSPYLPCAVDTLLRTIDLADVSASDVFVDVGSGVGRAALLVRFLTGAAVVGIEVQPSLVVDARCYAEKLNVPSFATIAGDAAELARYMVTGSVFFLYCPFGGRRLEQVVDGIAPIAKTRPIQICSVDLNLPARSWLRRVPTEHRDVAVFENTLPHFTFPSRYPGARSPLIKTLSREP